ncbi:MAG: isochorismate synthase MenF [Myxococcales bacterium]
MALDTAAVPRLAGVCAEARPGAAPPSLGPLRFSWSHPERGLRVGAYGEAVRREAGAGGLAALLAALSRADGVTWLDGAADARPRPPGPWFGAVAFDPSRAAWTGFAQVRFAAPRLLVWEDAGRTHLAAFAPEGEATLGALQAALDGARRAFDAPGLPDRDRPVPEPAHRRAAVLQDGRARWEGLVDLALQRIRGGELCKVVVARTMDVPAAPAVELLFARLERAYPQCRIFRLAGDGGADFVGATPENFCSLDGPHLRTEALAGSARPAEASALLRRPKDLREHEWVVEHIASGLRGISEMVEVPALPAVRELATVAHLHTPIAARLRSGMGLADVVAALHPTPAVGGVPSAAAVRFLGKHEDLDRGLYAGLIGLVGPARAELAVALRCALLSAGAARLFLGAGIVEGSSPESEWMETQLKARALLDALESPA